MSIGRCRGVMRLSTAAVLAVIVERLAQAPPAVFDYLRRLLARH